MSDLTQKELETIGQESGEAARSQMLAAFKRRKITPDLVALRLKQLMNWKETKFFQYEGTVSDERRVRDGGTIFRATALVADIFGARAPEKVDHDHQVTILRPDPIEKRDK